MQNRTALFSAKAGTRSCPIPICLLMFASLALFFLNACAIPAGPKATEQRVAYHVFNHTGSARIVMPQLHDAGTGVRLYANLQAGHPAQASGRSGSWVWSESGGAESVSAYTSVAYSEFAQRLPTRPIPSSAFEQAPPSEALMLPRPAAGAFQSALTLTHYRLPDAVLLSWRAPALPGEQRFKGQLNGPHRLALRAAIPSKVLEQLAQSSDHRLEVAIGASSTAPIIVWRLTNQINDEFEVLARGSVAAVRLVAPSKTL